MTEKQLNEVLEELGREHRAVSAPDSLRSTLFDAAGGRKAVMGEARLWFPWAWAAVAVMLAVVAGVGVTWRLVQTHQAQTNQPQKQQQQTQQAHSLPAHQVSPEPARPSDVGGGLGVVRKAAPVRAAVKARAPLSQPSPPDAPTSSSLDAFVPLPASEGLPAAAELSIVRIRLRGSDLQQYGLQTPADAVARTMLAEFAVGEDGLPRAIRIVR